MQPPSGDRVEAALARVFDRPEFAERESPALLQLVSDLIAAFRQWVVSLLAGWLPDRWHPVFTWVLIGVLCALAAWALYALVKAVVGSPGVGGAPVPRPGGVELRGESAEAWESASRTASASGRFREAAVALYIAAVLRLEERGMLRYHPGKTPGDYRSEIRSYPNTRPPFDAFIRQFLPLAFGARAPDAAAFRSLAASASELGVNG